MNEICDKISDGDIILSKDNTMLHHVLGAFQKLTHCAIVYTDGDKKIVYSMSKNRARTVRRELETYLLHSHVWVVLRPSYTYLNTHELTLYCSDDKAYSFFNGRGTFCTKHVNDWLLLNGLSNEGKVFPMQLMQEEYTVVVTSINYSKESVVHSIANLVAFVLFLSIVAQLISSFIQKK